MRLREFVETLADLKPDMILEEVVTNVAAFGAFGAFVDIGVHQDGLVHISALANTFVKDPHSVVKTGQVVKVKVLEVDEKRKRIALTMRLSDAAEKPASRPDVSRQPRDGRAPNKAAGGNPNRARASAPMGSAMAAAFKKLKG